ncbi:MAG: hypothetical protein UT33_C0015G0045 [Candidatus Peregrinibacteria bacterium GW2011_GWC2_39_14]|nr:MAG: hypothetical protein US92_C0009G0003 [Candidatus Peregrinibacteria bacterium GW2011_GWA2_38_36]KKR04988.1 MAG: hypothetical protein UT33_C0015G0045 [Candidatus Peregrinibacteria bacterium GW2011_GWC2_39_14]
MPNRRSAPTVLPEVEYDKDALAVTTWMLQGKSLVDFVGPTVTTHESFIKLLRVNGYDIKNPKDRAELESIKEEAIMYAAAQLETLSLTGNLDKSLPREIDEHLLSASIKELFEIAAGTHQPPFHPNVNRQACIILKYIFVESYIRRSTEFIFQHEAYGEVLGFLSNNFESTDTGEWRFKANPDSKTIPAIYYVQSGEKSKSSTARKLMVKDDVTASSMIDHVRVRVITETVVDILKLLYSLVRECRIPWNNSVPRRPKQELLDFRRIEELIKHPEQAEEFVKRLMEDPEAIDGIRVIKKTAAAGRKGKAVNENSSDGFQCVSWIIEFPVPITVVKNGEIQTLFINYPVEFQVADRKTAERNWTKRSDVWDDVKHEVYEARQVAKVGARLKMTASRVKAVVGEEEVAADLAQFRRVAEVLGMPQADIARLMAGVVERVDGVIEDRNRDQAEILMERFREIGASLSIPPGEISRLLGRRGAAKRKA